MAAGIGISNSVREAFISWLQVLDKCVERNVHSHRVRSRVSVIMNAYEFALGGCVTMG